MASFGPLPPVPSTALCRVVTPQSTHESQNLWYFNWTAGVATDADMLLMANTLFDGYAAIYSGVATGGNHYVSSDTQLLYVSAIDLTSPTAAFAKSTRAPQVGAAAQKSINNSAFLLRKPIARRYRGGHGRCYFAGITGDNTTDGREWNVGTIQADMVSAMNAALGAVDVAAYPNIAGVHPVLVSYYDLHGVPVPPHRRVAPLVEAFSGPLTSDLVIRSQRRRVRNTPTPS